MSSVDKNVRQNVQSFHNLRVVFSSLRIFAFMSSDCCANAAGAIWMTNAAGRKNVVSGFGIIFCMILLFVCVKLLKFSRLFLII